MAHMLLNSFHSVLQCLHLLLCCVVPGLWTTINLLHSRDTTGECTDIPTHTSNGYILKNSPFSAFCSVSITHQGFRLEWANNMLAWCEIRALQERGEIGWLVLHSSNYLCRRLPGAGGALCTNLSYIRKWDGQRRATGRHFLATQLGWSD